MKISRGYRQFKIFKEQERNNEEPSRGKSAEKFKSNAWTQLSGQMKGHMARSRQALEPTSQVLANQKARTIHLKPCGSLAGWRKERLTNNIFHTCQN